MPVKQNLKEHYEDGKLDLSMLGLTEVPVKDIAAIPKATNLDLSNNRLTTFGKNFPSSLTYLVHLDLARNHLTELPENIGLLVNLKHLDLYSNQLTSLPLSFGNLKALKWLDLKQNPLMPKLAQIAGPCLDSAQCASAARNVVELLAMMNKQVETEKQRRQEQRQKQLEENVRKAQEQKKELQLQKRKNKKAKREENEQTKLLKSMGNGDGALITDEALNENDEMLDSEELIDNDSSESGDGMKSSLKIPSVTSKVLAVFGTLIKTIVILTLLMVLSLFILNLIDEDYYNSTMKHINKVKHQVSYYIPASVSTKYNKMYYSSRKMFWRTTNRFGKKSLVLIQQVRDWYLSVSNDETVLAYYYQIKSGWQVLWIRISEIFRTFWVHS